MRKSVYFIERLESLVLPGLSDCQRSCGIGLRAGIYLAGRTGLFAERALTGGGGGGIITAATNY